MRAPGFWWRPRPSAPGRLLQPLGLVYGAVAARRMRRPGEQAAPVVICVGNFTIGGAGKTPTAMALADLVARMGERPAFLTRGYGGRLAGPVRVDPDLHDAGEVGDEPLLLARQTPTIVSRDRPAGARLCLAQGASVVIMDDGLQNPSLAKDLALVVVDGATGFGNGLCIPAGPLRAPLDAQWTRVDGLILVGAGTAGEEAAADAERRGKPVIRAALAPDPAAAERLRGRRVLAFAGIARPEKFFATLEACGAIVAERQGFPDHHAFAVGEIEAILDRAGRNGLVPVTTEKDLVRIAPHRAAKPSGPRITALPVRLAWHDSAAVSRLIASRLVPWR